MSKNSRSTQPKHQAAIVVGVDGSEASLAALAFAAAEARLRGVGLSVVHVAHYPIVAAEGGMVVAVATEEEILAASQHLLDQATAQVDLTGITWETKIYEGAPALELASASKASDLLVVGTRGRGGFKGLLLGSVSAQLIHDAACPIAVVHRRPAGSPVGTILVGTDGSEHAEHALRWALAEAKLRGARIRVVQAWSQPFTYIGPMAGDGAIASMVPPNEMIMASRASIESTLAKVDAKSSGVEIDIEAIEGPAAAVLLEAAAGAELLVLGSRGMGGFKGRLLGSISHQCVQHAPCPVVLMR